MVKNLDPGRSSGHGAYVSDPPLLVCLPSLSRKTCEGKKPKAESTTSVMMTWTISSRESSCLANCSPLLVSVHCRMVFVQSVQEASVCACSQCHGWQSRDCPVLASVAQWPEIQSLISSGQLACTHGQTISYNLI